MVSDRKYRVLLSVEVWRSEGIDGVLEWGGLPVFILLVRDCAQSCVAHDVTLLFLSPRTDTEPRLPSALLTG